MTPEVTALRDQFASQALVAIISRQRKKQPPRPDLDAWMAYWYADAMLAERGGPGLQDFRRTGWQDMEAHALDLLARARADRDEEETERAERGRQWTATEYPVFTSHIAKRPSDAPLIVHEAGEARLPDPQQLEELGGES